MRKFLVIFIAACGLALPATTRAQTPVTQPTTMSTGQGGAPNNTPSTDVPLPPRPPSKAMSNDFTVLLHRSIFMRGSPTMAAPGEFGSGAGSTTGPATTSPFVARPETNLVLNGVTQVDDHLAAFFEELSDHQVLITHEGENIANGKLSQITLDGVDYLANGQTTHVNIGQNLTGADGPSLESQPVGEVFGSSTTGPSSGGDSILEKMRRRRLQETAH